MKGIKFDLPSIERPSERTSKKGGINGPHALAVHDLMTFMGEDSTNSKRFSYWCGQLRNAQMTPSLVRDYMKKAKAEGKSPRKLFNYLLKVRREDIKKQQHGTKKEKNSG